MLMEASFAGVKSNPSVAGAVPVAYNGGERGREGGACRLDRVVWGCFMSGVRGRSGRKPKWTDEQIEEAADSLLDWLEADPENHIWFKSWAIENGIAPQYLSLWAEKNRIFREAMEIAERTQKEGRLVEGGLRNKFNARNLRPGASGSAPVAGQAERDFHDGGEPADTGGRTAGSDARRPNRGSPVAAIGRQRAGGRDGRRTRYGRLQTQMLMLDIVEQAKQVGTGIVGE